MNCYYQVVPTGLNTVAYVKSRRDLIIESEFFICIKSAVGATHVLNKWVYQPEQHTGRYSAAAGTNIPYR